MYLIFGLGNMGKEYQHSRHNAGFVAVDRLLSKLCKKAEFKKEPKFEAEMIRIGELIIAKPSTFMNASGDSVRKIACFYKVETENIIVIHDDLDIRLGEYKIQKGVGPKVHNGIASVEKLMGDKNFVRIRLGVDNRQKENKYGSGADYVLSKMSKEEITILERVLDLALGDLAVTLGLEFE